MIKNIKFTEVENELLNKLSDDVKNIRNSKDLLVFADKSTNLYDVTASKYRSLLKDNITKDYKKCSEQEVNHIDKEAKKIAAELKLHDRVQRMSKKNAFITLKDHKDNFSHNVKCRLINPAKSSISIVSKVILDNINNSIRESQKSLQWRNTSAVITWFNSIEHKSKCKFIKFDVVNFYPSISENLLNKSLTFAKSLVKISDRDINIIRHSCQSLLFNEEMVCGRRRVKEASLM